MLTTESDATPAKARTMRELAADVLSQLDSLSVRFPGDASEMERVLNLGVPLANMIRHGLVRSVTPAGRDSLIYTYRNIVACHAILSDYPELSGNFVILWEEITDRVHSYGRIR